MTTHKTPADRTIYIAKDSFTIEIKGHTYNVIAGRTRVRAGHVLLAADRMQLFEPITVDYDVEDASATPGEARS